MKAKKLANEILRLVCEGGKATSNIDIVINKATFKHPLEIDGCCMLEIESASIETYNILNDEGGLGHGENDKEKFKSSIVLKGGAPQF